MQVGRASPPLAACAALVTYTLIHEELSAEDAFVTISIFQALRPITIIMPMGFAALASFGNALRRIQGFLDEEDHPLRETIVDKSEASETAVRWTSVIVYTCRRLIDLPLNDDCRLTSPAPTSPGAMRLKLSWTLRTFRSKRSAAR